MNKNNFPLKRQITGHKQGTLSTPYNSCGIEVSDLQMKKQIAETCRARSDMSRLSKPIAGPRANTWAGFSRNVGRG